MKKIVLIFLLAFMAASAWVWRGELRAFFSEGGGFGSAVEELASRAGTSLDELKRDVSAPPPLRGSRTGAAADLTAEGTVTWTNFHRKENGLAPLAVNAQLAAAAKLKLDDMFARQYFEHVSPTGEGPADVITAAGYAYVAVGENLAEGFFAGDAGLVQAWMDSPGHRENILSGRFTEIGVAVGTGMLNGRRTWMAVQEFGKPLSDCPYPDPALQGSIATNETRIDRLKAEADRLKAELDAMGEPRTRKEAEAYNRKVDEYNTVAAELNALIETTKTLIEEYNRQVAEFNACAAA